MGIEGMDELKPGAQPASDTPDDSGLQTPLPDQEIDVAPDADEPGDTEVDPEIADLQDDDHEHMPDQVDQPPTDG